MFLARTPEYQLYLLQLENYELKRYLKLLFKKGLLTPDEPLRKHLVWTAKARALFVGAIIVHVLLVFLVCWLLGGGLFASSMQYYILCLSLFAISYLLFPLYFVSYSLFTALLGPADYFVKKLIVRKAKAVINKFPHIKVVGVAGSYGKTTMKEVLKQVLGVKFKVLATPDSINTPLGIARWVLKKFSSDLEIAIVEMGEHYRGDVQEICEIIKPDVAIVTGINEAHMERMGNLENVAATVFEAVAFAKTSALVILNKDDQHIEKYYSKFVQPSQKLDFYSALLPGFEFSQQILGWQGVLPEVGEVKVRLIGKYGIGLAQAGAGVGKSFGLTNQQIARGLGMVKPAEHRLEPILSPQNILVIDDSYNGNPDGAKEAVEALSRFSGRRKIYLTPGLVEMGDRTQLVHMELGRQLAIAADVVILIKNSVTSFIEQGIKSAVSSQQSAVQVLWFNTAPDAHKALANILKSGDVIIFQNDWGDNYI